MLYEITIWRRTAGAPQLLATRHELGRLTQIKDVAKRMLRDAADANALFYVRVAEAHNGREAFVCRFDQLG